MVLSLGSVEPIKAAQQCTVNLLNLSALYRSQVRVTSSFNSQVSLEQIARLLNYIKTFVMLQHVVF